MTYRTALRAAEDRLRQAGIQEYKTEAWLLFEYVFAMDRARFLMCADTEAAAENCERYLALSGRRAEHIPLQYLTGSQCFCGYEFMVNEHVLIPRMDTEILVEQAVDRIGSQPWKILDMCTGSGCIAVTVAKMCPDIQVTAVDVSREALEVAEYNRKHNQAENVTLLHSDLFEQVSGTYHMILSNPPYIETGKIAELMPEVREHEPLLALDGAEDGLFFYRSITEKSVHYLKSGGYLLYEIGCCQAEAVSSIMDSCGYHHIQTVKDLAGLDRVVIGRL